MSASQVGKHDDWREITRRFKEIWAAENGGTVEAIADALLAEGVSVDPASLARHFGPRGRRPRLWKSYARAFAALLAKKRKERSPILQQQNIEIGILDYLLSRREFPGNQGSNPVTPVTARPTPERQPLDLWTPGPSRKLLVARFVPELGRQSARALSDICQQSIVASVDGNFKQLLFLGTRANRLARFTTDTRLWGEALYLIGEAHRLAADFEPQPRLATHKRQLAQSSYEKAIEYLEGDARPVRGLARTLEVLGSHDEALSFYQIAIDRLETRFPTHHEGQDFSLVHERLRSERHKVSCLATVESQTTIKSAYSQRRRDQIQLALKRSEQWHRQGLPLFQKDYREWYWLEWFMGSVFHARGHAAIGEVHAAAHWLGRALEARLKLLPPTGLLSPRETGNFRWWMVGYGTLKESLGREQRKALDLLSESLDTGGLRASIHIHGQEVLRAERSPWANG